jgi:hypothetical protein
MWKHHEAGTRQQTLECITLRWSPVDWLCWVRGVGVGAQQGVEGGGIGTVDEHVGLKRRLHTPWRWILTLG